MIYDDAWRSGDSPGLESLCVARARARARAPTVRVRVDAHVHVWMCVGISMYMKCVFMYLSPWRRSPLCGIEKETRDSN